MTEFNTDGLSIKTEPSVTTLEADAGIAYAKATNDPIALHLDGTYIPPIYAVVPVWEKVFEVVSAVVPEEHFFQVVHGEQDMYFHKALKSGIELSSIAIGQSISVKETGTTLVVKSESRDNAGEMVLEQYFTMFFRGIDGGLSVGTPHETGIDIDAYKTVVSNSASALAKVQAHMDDDQTFRYAQASGDFMPIHIDDEFAKSVGLGGIIIHGLCTMANASWAAITSLCDSDPTKLKRMALRFSKPLRPGDDINTYFFESDKDSSYYFVTKRASDDETILTNALVEVDK